MGPCQMVFRGSALTGKSKDGRGRCGCRKAHPYKVDNGAEWKDSKFVTSGIGGGGVLQASQFLSQEGNYCFSRPVEGKSCEPVPQSAPSLPPPPHYQPPGHSACCPMPHWGQLDLNSEKITSHIECSSPSPAPEGGCLGSFAAASPAGFAPQGCFHAVSIDGFLKRKLVLLTGHFQRNRCYPS